MYFTPNLILSVLAVSALDHGALSAPVQGTAEYSGSALNSTEAPAASVNKRASSFGIRPSATPGAGGAAISAGPSGVSNSTQSGADTNSTDRKSVV